jgi:hypothetical protein
MSISNLETIAKLLTLVPELANGLLSDDGKKKLEQAIDDAKFALGIVPVKGATPTPERQVGRSSDLSDAQKTRPTPKPPVRPIPSKRG